MLKYIVKRLIYMIPTLIGVTLIVFLIVSLMPGDPAKMILGDNAPPEAILELREELGLNKPLHIRYLDYMSDLLRGDMGESFATGKSVSEEIASRFPVTAELALFSILFSVGIGIPVGVVSAVKQYSLLDSVTVILTLLFASVPTFWLGLMLMLVFGLRLEWFPTSGINEGIRSYILPALSMATISLSMIARMTRSTMLEAIRGGEAAISLGIGAWSGSVGGDGLQAASKITYNRIVSAGGSFGVRQFTYNSSRIVETFSKEFIKGTARSIGGDILIMIIDNFAHIIADE